VATRRSDGAGAVTPLSPDSKPGILDRTLTGFRAVWRELATLGGRTPIAVFLPTPSETPDSLRKQMSECLEAPGGEVSARARAARLGSCYLDLDAKGRLDFLRILAHEFGTNPAAVAAAIAAYQAAPDEVRRLEAEEKMREALTAPRIKLLTQFNALPQGVKFLVDMRRDLLRHLDTDFRLGALDRDMRAILTAWFDIGFLDLQRITWNSPAALLEKLIAYEAVHEIRGWSDLRNRLDSDRRCYAFFHPRMPEEPLIFIEVALVKGIAGSVQALLDESAPVVDPAEVDSAIFYSISNTQEGLRGISFGNFLIKRVVDDLLTQMPKLKTFSTLSPIPGFRRWLERLFADGEPDLLTVDDRQRLAEATGQTGGKGAFLRLIKSDSWHQDPVLCEAMKPILLRLCARYLTTKTPGGKPLDPVGRFHLGNGASIERINWLGDTSPNGMRQSLGIMVNYLYKLSDIEKNHERHSRDGFIPVSSGVRQLMAA